MMSPETLPIDRRFKGVGRLKRASGTLNPAVLRQINRMLTVLGGQPTGLPILRALRDRDLSFLAVLDAYQRDTLDELPTGTAARRLVPAMEAWADSLRVPQDVSREHHAMLGTARRHIEALKPLALVAELPALVEVLRDTLGKPHPTAFNNLRAVALAFVRDTMKRSHPLWLAVSAVERRKVKAGDRARHRPLRLEEMRSRFPAPQSDPVDAIAWGMATTGMGQKEYWGRWAVKSDRIHVSGTKRGGRDRDVPLVRVPTVPTMHRRTFENKLRARDRQWTPYNLRRTYANWMEDAGIPRTRRRSYLGHGAADDSDLYERREVDAYLAEDAKRLRALLGEREKAARLKVVKGGK